MTELQLAGRDEVEVAHEALIRHWPRLRQWLDQDRTALLLRESVREAAQEWERHGQDESYLVHRGRRLAEVEALAHHPRFTLNAQEQAYLDAAVALREREEQEREAQRQRELDAQRERAELAEAARHEAEQRVAEQVVAAGRLRRRFLIAAGLGAVAILAAIGAFWGFRQATTEANARATEVVIRTAAEMQAAQDRDRAIGSEHLAATREADAVAAEATAVHEAQVARSRQLAADALNRSGERYDLALLLGIEAMRAADTVEARASLFSLVSDPDVPQFLHGHSKSVASVAFSPDGTILASAGGDNTIVLWDLATGQPRGAPLVGHAAGIHGVAFSSDGTTLASGSCGRPEAENQCREGEIRFWDVASSKQIGAPLAGHTGTVVDVAFSPDGTMLATGGEDGAVIVWDVSAKRPRGAPLLGHQRRVNSVAFSPDGTLLASGSFDSTIRLWDPTAGEPRGDPVTGHDGEVLCVAFSPDGTTLASGGYDKTVRRWDVETREQQGEPLSAHTDVVYDLAYSLDGAMLISGSFDRTVIRWDAETGQQRGEPLIGAGQRVTTVAVNVDGTVATGDLDGTVALWNTSGRPRIGEAYDAQGEGRSVAFSPDGKTLALGRYDRVVYLWDMAALNAPPAILTGHANGVWNLAFSPDSATLASAGCARFVEATCQQGEIILWDVAGHRARGDPLIGHSDSIYSLAFSPDGKTLASGSWDGTVLLWDTATGQQRGAPLAGHAGKVNSVAFSQDGTVLAVADDERVVLWDPATSQQRGEPLAGHIGNVSDLTFSPDGTTLVTGSGDTTIRLWDFATGRQLGAPLQNSAEVIKLAMSHDGATLASGGGDGTLTLWDLSTSRALGEPLPGHDKFVDSLAFSPDGKRLVSIAVDGTVLFWKVGAESWEVLACALSGRNFTAEEWSQYFGQEPYRPTCADSVLNEANLGALKGEAQAASDAFAEAARLAIATNDPEINNSVCWYGSLGGFAAVVRAACDRAVELAPASGFYSDSRGLSRALEGDTGGAIADFERYVGWAKVSSPDNPLVPKREAWIAELKNGRNPFDPETLQGLRIEHLEIMPANVANGVQGNTYTGPNYGHTLVWDGDVWTVEGVAATEEQDWLRLSGGASVVDVKGFAGHNGDPEACLRNAAAEFRAIPGAKEFSIASDLAQPTTVSDVPSAAVVLRYTYEPEGGGTQRKMVAFIECLSLVDGEAVLEVDQLVPASGYVEDLPLVESLLAGLVLPEEPGAANSATPALPGPNNSPGHGTPSPSGHVGLGPTSNRPRGASWPLG